MKPTDNNPSMSCSEAPVIVSAAVQHRGTVDGNGRPKSHRLEPSGKGDDASERHSLRSPIPSIRDGKETVI